MARTAAATAAYGVVHSLLASRTAKDAAERWLGTRRRNALYRPAYNLIATAGLVGLVGYINRQPSRTLYCVGWPAAGLMRAGQVASLAVLAAATWRVGPLRFAGGPGLWAWLRNAPAVPREPEGQNPPPQDMVPRGAFALTRHPLNAFPVPLLWLQPTMTSNLAAFNAVTTVYLVVGTLLTERRLRARYGQMYERYRQSGVPLFVPRPGSGAEPTDSAESASVPGPAARA